MMTSFSGYGDIPVLPSGFAQADGVDGSLTGDVSKPGAVMAVGLSESGSFSLDLLLGGLSVASTFNPQKAVNGIQMFVGTQNGSASLPTITGTPIHLPTAQEPNGRAARIDMTGFQLDLGGLFGDDPGMDIFNGMVFNLPDISFVPTGTAQLEPNPGWLEPVTNPDTGETEHLLVGKTTGVIRVPLGLLGENNAANPGNTVTSVENPVQSAVSLHHKPGDQSESLAVNGKTFLFDTGAQLTIISESIAESLGLNLNSPEWTIDVQGAARAPIGVAGFTIDSLELPCDTDGDGIVDDTLRFTEVPVHVLDLGFGLDGILGMNLFNTAAEMLYDPFGAEGPYLDLTFFDPDTYLREIPDGGEMDLLDVFSGVLAQYGMAGMLGVWHENNYMYHQFLAPAVPEPSTMALLAMGAIAMLVVRRRRRAY